MRRTACIGFLVVLFLSACAGLAPAPTATLVPPTAAPAAGKTSPVKLGPVSVGSGSYTNISVDELKTMLGKKDFNLVNVHIPYAGEIADTDAFIPYDQIDQNLDKLPADKNARIVLYCRSGSMSTSAAEALVKDGYTHVFNLAGGMNAWAEKQYPLINKAK